MPLWLVGMMGSGKTEIGSRLAERLGCLFFDTDRMVADDAQATIAGIFSTEGEPEVRIREQEALRKAASYPDAVVAAGGGVVLDQANVEVMRATGPVIWLQADPKVLAERVGPGGDRPLLAGGDTVDRLNSMLQDRSAAYHAAADHVVVTDRVEPERVVELVEELWNAS
jgi:shikimate kinase